MGCFQGFAISTVLLWTFQSQALSAWGQVSPGGIPRSGIAVCKFRKVFYTELYFVCNSELKDMGFVHSDLIKSHSPQVGALILHIFQRGVKYLAEGPKAGCGADLGVPALLWDPPCLYPCILPRFRAVKARSSPLMQPSSSLMSLQSYSLSHCWLPWMQVPSKHWNSSGRHVATARKDRARVDFSQGEAEMEESPSLKKQFSDGLTGLGRPGPWGHDVNGGALDMEKHTQPPPPVGDSGIHFICFFD